MFLVKSIGLLLFLYFCLELLSWNGKGGLYISCMCSAIPVFVVFGVPVIGTIVRNCNSFKAK